MNHRYNYFKIFNFPDQLRRVKLGEAVAPIHIRLKPTNRCNHSCDYCAYRNPELILGKHTDINDELTHEQLMNICHDIIEMKVKAVTLTGGGEPLLHPSIKEAIGLLGQNNIAIGINTNGARLHDVEDLSNYLSWVRISIDGFDAPSYSAIRNVSQKEFSKVISNIESFSKKTITGINLVVTHQNYMNLSNFCSQLKELGVDHVKLSACITSDNLNYHSSISSSVTDQINRAKKLADDSFSIIDHYHHDTPNFIPKEYNQCYILPFLTVIGANNTIYSCNDKAYSPSGKIAHIGSRGYKNTWFDPETQKRIRELNPKEVCKHHCTAHKKNQLLENFFSIAEEHHTFI